MLRRVGVVDADEGDGLVGVLVVDHLNKKIQFLDCFLWFLNW